MRTFIIACALALGAGALALHSEVPEGKAIFERRCTGCHSLDQNKTGPKLRGVFGRRSGSVPLFPYSDALKNAAVVWDRESLDQWLTDTDKLVPDNDMAFRVPDGQERAAIIRYLSGLTAN